MEPNTINLILFIEQMAALLAKSIVDLKNVIQGSSTATVDSILADADASYQKVIATAQGSMSAPPAPAPVPPTDPPTNPPTTTK